MIYTRFANILVNLHLCDPQKDWKNEAKKTGMSLTILFFLFLLEEEFGFACSCYHVPCQVINFDERMVAFKGRVDMKQYTEDKPTK